MIDFGRFQDIIGVTGEEGVVKNWKSVVTSFMDNPLRDPFSLLVT